MMTMQQQHAFPRGVPQGPPPQGVIGVSITFTVTVMLTGSSIGYITVTAMLTVTIRICLQL